MTNKVKKFASTRAHKFLGGILLGAGSIGIAGVVKSLAAEGVPGATILFFPAGILSVSLGFAAAGLLGSSILGIKDKKGQIRVFIKRKSDADKAASIVKGDVIKTKKGYVVVKGLKKFLKSRNKPFRQISVRRR